MREDIAGRRASEKTWRQDRRQDRSGMRKSVCGFPPASRSDLSEPVTFMLLGRPGLKASSSRDQRLVNLPAISAASAVFSPAMLMRPDAGI
ncbi:hypothetical protein CN151_02990 [Sinorhizobium meliloti]|nr:hypothetical protein SMB554_01610 [Sinorhizobium meliloti]PST29333.1 hypothetical protein C7U62_01685 [Mesorhizobium loti]PTD26887.1 hypothetical protein C5N13_18900 [Sinorhizobium meliloti]QGJ72826.1 hypothetical protein C3L21_01600 [Sinorhizobium meliloti]RMI24139.1 hypothetical protein DA102_017850 [Sinorhizobium meliloti]